jgi:hypothetical protein
LQSAVLLQRENRSSWARRWATLQSRVPGRGISHHSVALEVGCAEMCVISARKSVHHNWAQHPQPAMQEADAWLSWRCSKMASMSLNVLKWH